MEPNTTARSWLSADWPVPSCSEQVRTPSSWVWGQRPRAGGGGSWCPAPPPPAALPTKGPQKAESALPARLLTQLHLQTLWVHALLASASVPSPQACPPLVGNPSPLSSPSPLPTNTQRRPAPREQERRRQQPWCPLQPPSCPLLPLRHLAPGKGCLPCSLASRSPGPESRSARLRLEAHGCSQPGLPLTRLPSLPLRPLLPTQDKSGWLSSLKFIPREVPCFLSGLAFLSSRSFYNVSELPSGFPAKEVVYLKPCFGFKTG